MRCLFLFSVMFLGVVAMANAQACPAEHPNGPSTESAPRTLTGKIVFHDEIRKWLGLILDAPVCGQSEIQLLPDTDKLGDHSIEVFRECRAVADGALGLASTGYYSTDVYQIVETISAEGNCLHSPEFPDYSNAKPRNSVRRYRVLMRLDYKARGGKIEVMARSGNRSLRPWQAYASYTLTGGYAFYAGCSNEFSMSHVRGTPQAKPSRIENEAWMDPETAAAKHVHLISLSFMCSR